VKAVWILTVLFGNRKGKLVDRAQVYNVVLNHYTLSNLVCIFVQPCPTAFTIEVYIFDPSISIDSTYNCCIIAYSTSVLMSGSKLLVIGGFLPGAYT
jgi:hypothetical protein